MQNFHRRVDYSVTDSWPAARHSAVSGLGNEIASTGFQVAKNVHRGLRARAD
jgi:hypothetical protein